MEDRRSIAKKAAIGVALVIAAAGAVLFYKNNIAMNPGDTLLKYMSVSYTHLTLPTTPYV